MNPTGLYDHPAWYDILHEKGTAAEVDRLEWINRHYGNGGRRWLEPACGTGRFLRVLARRRYRATGYDLHEQAVEYARQRLRAAGLKAEVLRADMTRFIRPGAFDLAFNLINTFRHILDEEAALEHLRRTAASLWPGGVYVLGIDLIDYRRPDLGEEVWTARRGSLRLRHVMFNVPPSRRTRREKIINHVIAQTPKRKQTFECIFELLAYDLGQWRRLLDRSPFRVVAAFDFAWEPIALDRHTRDVNLVLTAT